MPELSVQCDSHIWVEWSAITSSASTKPDSVATIFALKRISWDNIGCNGRSSFIFGSACQSVFRWVLLDTQSLQTLHALPKSCRWRVCSCEGHAGADGMCIGSDDGEDMRPVKMSALTFVDLAGSERMNQLDRDESAQRARQTEVSTCWKA